MELELKDDVERIRVDWKATINWKSNSGNRMDYEFSNETIFTRDNLEASGKTLAIWKFGDHL